MAAIRRQIGATLQRRAAVLAVSLVIAGSMGLAPPSAKGDEMPNPFDVVYSVLVQKFNGANNLTAYDDVFSVQEFVEIWNDPEKYVPAALEHLADPAKPGQSKLIAMTAMHNLSAKNVSKYVAYCRELVALKKRGAIDEELLSYQIFSNDRVANLDAKEIVSFLEELKAEHVDEEAAEHFLAGKERSRTKFKYWPLRGDAGG